MPVYKTNLQIFFTGNILKENISKTSTLLIDELDYSKVDAWEVIAEFSNEEGVEVCGVYKSYDPDLEFYMIVFEGSPYTFNDKKLMYIFLEERGYVFNVN